MSHDFFARYDHQLSAHPDAALIRDLEAFFTENPAIKTAIVTAHDAEAKAQKSERLKSQALQFELFAPTELFLRPGSDKDYQPAAIAVAASRLEVGRPSTHPLLLFVCYSLCVGHYNGFGKKALARLTGCRFVHSFCAWHGFTLPSRSTLYAAQRLLNSSTVVNFVALQAQAGAQALEAAGHGDQTDIVIADSTPVVSASAKPCNEANAARLIVRAEVALVKAEVALGLPPGEALADNLKSATGQFLMGVSGSQSAAARAKNGDKSKAKKTAVRRATLLKQSRRTWVKTASRVIVKLDARLANIDLKLSKTSDWNGAIASRSDRANSSLMAAQRIVDVVADINDNGFEVAKEHEYPFSCSDDDASFIVKTGRTTVFGYKAQLAMSSRGFVFSFLLPSGNNADSKAYQPMLVETVAALGKAPRIFVVDDGYSAAENLAFAKTAGVSIPCFKGAKSKKLLGAAYDEEPQRQNRNKRSAVEGGNSRLKNDQFFGRARTFGIEAVTRELAFKVLIHNFLVLRKIIDPEFKLPHVCARIAAAA